MFGKKLLLVEHHVPGAPLVSSTLMAHLHMVRHCYIVVAHHMTGAPLVSIPSIALFLVVQVKVSGSVSFLTTVVIACWRWMSCICAVKERWPSISCTQALLRRACWTMELDEICHVIESIC